MTKLIPGKKYMWEGPSGPLIGHRVLDILDLTKRTVKENLIIPEVYTTDIIKQIKHELPIKYRDVDTIIYISSSDVVDTIRIRKQTIKFTLTYIGKCADGSIAFFKIGKCFFGLGSRYCKQFFRPKRKFSIMKGHIFPRALGGK